MGTSAVHLVVHLWLVVVNLWLIVVYGDELVVDLWLRTNNSHLWENTVNLKIVIYSALEFLRFGSFIPSDSGRSKWSD